MITNYTAEETVFGIPELRRHIFGFYLEKTMYKENHKKNVNKRLKKQ